MKKTALIMAGVLTAATSFAQFRMTFGASAILGLPKTYTARIGTAANNTGTEVSVGSGSYGVLLFPKYYFKNNLSVGVPLNIGLSFEGNSQTGSSGSFGYHLPICVTYHGGSSVYENEDFDGLAFGYYAGAGLGLANASENGYSQKTTIDTKSTLYASEEDFFNTINFKSFGPFVHAGFQLKNPLSKNTDSRNKIGLRIAYQVPVNKSLNYVFATITYGPR
jgi:hypothetical protein